MELSNVTISTPAKIEAGHDVGKSTIFKAVLFAITGKNIDSKEFDGAIYPKAAEMLSDLAVEVEIEQSGIVFNKKATGSEKREKGSDKTELQRSVTVTYSINHDAKGGKKAYEEKIKEVFGNSMVSCDHLALIGKLNKLNRFTIFKQPVPSYQTVYWPLARSLWLHFFAHLKL